MGLCRVFCDRRCEVFTPTGVRQMVLSAKSAAAALRGDEIMLRLRPVADTADTQSGKRQIGGYAQAIRDGGTRRGADLHENIGGKVRLYKRLGIVTIRENSRLKHNPN